MRDFYHQGALPTTVRPPAEHITSRYYLASEADAEITRLKERITTLEPAAECWNAIAACYRITCMGSAGVLQPTANGYAHATFNLWTAQGLAPEAQGDAQDLQGRLTLGYFVEVAIKNLKTREGGNT